MRIFLIAAIVLIVFMIIATAATTLFGVFWYTWLGASLLAFFVDLAFSGVYLAQGGFSVGPRQPGQPVV